jgi:8-oxo-dGTP pyrophosphatase MutT (NUDIX family)
MSRLLSSALLVRVAPGTLLVGHASGTRYWDIPKGLVEASEAPRSAAARELLEETGLQLDVSRWEDLGRQPYNSSKDLWLFRTPLLTEPIDLSCLRCSSTFVDRFGRVRPEFDRFALITRDQVESHCAPSMARLLLRLDW